jgi:hypothetical protein
MTRYRSRPVRRRSSGSPPGWFVLLVAAALVFGLYYLWMGMQNFFITGGLGVVETTERAVIVNTATAERFARSGIGAVDSTPVPTRTPIPACQDFIVIVPNAIIREEPSTQGAILTQLGEGEPVCVLGRVSEESEWYIIDQEPNRRRLEPAYMHETVIRAVNPTATPSRTPTALPTGSVTPLPTVTDLPTATPTAPPASFVPPTITPIPPTATPTLIPTETPIRQSA